MADGLLFGNPAQVGIQVVAVLAAIAYSGVDELRAAQADQRWSCRCARPPTDESAGLDVTQHGEEAYVHAEGSRTMLASTDEPAFRETPRLAESPSPVH